MVRPIMKDIFFLQQKSEQADKRDLNVAQDLQETLAAHEEECVGMAANMIGVKKRIIAVQLGFVRLLMINPEITAKSEPYETQEGCLSLSGVRPTTRYQTIEVTYQDKSFRKQKQTFSGSIAQIIQHEIDHCNGILI